MFPQTPKLQRKWNYGFHDLFLESMHFYPTASETFKKCPESIQGHCAISQGQNHEKTENEFLFFKANLSKGLIFLFY